LETDLSSYNDLINIPENEGRSSILRDHVDHEDQDCPQPFDERALTPPHLPSIWDPPGRHGAQLNEFLHSTRKKILDCLFVQVLRMKRYLEEQWRLNLIPEYEVLLEGLSLLKMMDPRLIGLQRSQEILLMILNRIIIIEKVLRDQVSELNK